MGTLSVVIFLILIALIVTTRITITRKADGRVDFKATLDMPATYRSTLKKLLEYIANEGPATQRK